MGTITTNYGTATAITCGAASLANNAARQSTAISNSSNVDDMTVQINAVSGTAGPLYVYLYSSIDGSMYTDGCTGSDASYTMPTNINMRPLGTYNCPTSSGAASDEFSVVNCKGFLPQTWGIVVLNSTGGTLSAFSAKYKTISYGD